MNICKSPWHRGSTSTLLQRHVSFRRALALSLSHKLELIQLKLIITSGQFQKKKKGILNHWEHSGEFNLVHNEDGKTQVTKWLEGTEACLRQHQRPLCLGRLWRSRLQVVFTCTESLGSGDPFSVQGKSTRSLKAFLKAGWHVLAWGLPLQSFSICSVALFSSALCIQM